MRLCDGKKIPFSLKQISVEFKQRECVSVFIEWIIFMIDIHCTQCWNLLKSKRYKVAHDPSDQCPNQSKITDWSVFSFFFFILAHDITHSVTSEWYDPMIVLWYKVHAHATRFIKSNYRLWYFTAVNAIITVIRVKLFIILTPQRFFCF